MDPTIIILPELLGLIGFLLWMALSARERRRRLEMIGALHERLFDRIGSLQEFSEFVQTPQGQALMRSLTTDLSLEAPYARVIRAVQIGVVLVSASAGFFVVGRTVVLDAPELRPLLDVLSILSLALGAGSIASGVIASLMMRASDASRVQRSSST